MIDQEINEAIALACGWIYYDGWHHPDGMSELPNYCTDLNAMHDVVMDLSGNRDFVQTYCNQLRKVVGVSEWSTFALENATARQRAEAFLRTIGKWKEESK